MSIFRAVGLRRIMKRNIGGNSSIRSSKRVKKESGDAVNIKSKAGIADLGSGVKKGKSSNDDLLLEVEQDYLAVNGSAKLSVGLQRLKEDFFDVPCEQLAKSLLGKVLVRRLENGTLVRGRIVETECYPGGDDKGSVTYNGKITQNTKALYMKPGVMFVYMTYGMYHCFNISSQGSGAAVLLRALEPLDGKENMQKARAAMKKSSKKSELKEYELCNGPAKLCICFNISKKECNMRDLCVWDDMWIEADDLSCRLKDHPIVTSTRIGIDFVGKKWASLPFRFYLFGFNSVSRIDKTKAQDLQEKCSVPS